MQQQIEMSKAFFDKKVQSETSLLKKTARISHKAVKLTLANSGHTLESSLSELIDNSIDAGATDVKIICPPKSQKSEPVIEIWDNGNGMDQEEIEKIPEIGSERVYEPDDIGFFGIGGTQAILSLSEKVIIRSKKKGSDSYTILEWDIEKDGLDYIIHSEKTTDLEKSGTHIKCFSGSKYDKLYRQESTLYKTLGTKYFHLLTKEGHKKNSFKKLFSLTINKTIIEPIDPMYRNDNNTIEYEQRSIKMNHSDVVINTYYLGNITEPNLYDSRDNAGFNVTKSGIYLLYNGRYLNLGGNWASIKNLHPETRTTRVEVLIPKEAIQEFGIQSNKNEPKFEIDTSHPNKIESEFIKIICEITGWAHSKSKEKDKMRNNSQAVKEDDEKMTSVLNKLLKNKNIKKTPLDDEEILKQIPNSNSEDDEHSTKTKNRPSDLKYNPQVKRFISFERKSYGESDSFIKLERENKTTKLILNIDHNFYKNFYEKFDETAKVNLNLFLYSLANGEQKSYGDNHFDTNELMKLWSRFWRDSSDALSDYL